MVRMLTNSIKFLATTTATVNAFQKPLFNLDPKIESTPAAPANVTSSGDTEKLLENLTVCKPTSANNDKTCESYCNKTNLPIDKNV